MQRPRDRSTRLAPLFLLALTTVAGCGSDSGTKPTDQVPDNGDTPTYTADVKPILTAGCSCHHPGGIMYATDPLDTYASVYAKRDRVKQRAGVDGSMPPTGALSMDKRQTIIAWVDGGAPE